MDDDFPKIEIKDKPKVSLLQGVRLRRQSEAWTASTFSSPIVKPASVSSTPVFNSPAHQYLYNTPTESFHSELAPGSLLASYEVIAVIGRGATSVCYECFDKESDSKVCLKVIHNSNYSTAKTAELKDTIGKKDRDSLLLDAETTIWSRLSSPWIVEMLQILHLDESTVIVSEIADGGNLLDYIPANGTPGLPEATSQRLFGQLMAGVAYMHDNGIVHRDIKLENLLLHRGQIKICDFGLATELLQLTPQRIEPHFFKQRATSLIEMHPRGCVGLCCAKLARTKTVDCFPLQQEIVGSLHYCPPELLQLSERKIAQPVYTSLTDVYSCGCCLYAMLTGTLPFNEQFLPRLQLNIMNNKYDLNKITLTAGREVVQGMLQPEPERWSVGRISRHPWVIDPE